MTTLNNQMVVILALTCAHFGGFTGELQAPAIAENFLRRKAMPDSYSDCNWPKVRTWSPNLVRKWDRAMIKHDKTPIGFGRINRITQSYHINPHIYIYNVLMIDIVYLNTRRYYTMAYIQYFNFYNIVAFHWRIRGQILVLYGTRCFILGIHRPSPIKLHPARQGSSQPHWCSLLAGNLRLKLHRKDASKDHCPMYHHHISSPI